jgi:hypothetical protein
MGGKHDVGEDGGSAPEGPIVTKDATDRLAEVQGRLREMRKHKRGEVRWTVSSRTAELAIGAIEAMGRPKPPSRKGKSRRRKRTKRLL